MQSRPAEIRQNLIATLLVLAAIVLGGGGTPAPVPEMILQVLALLLLTAWAFPAAHHFPRLARLPGLWRGWW